jgi:hypothetical protein
MKLAGYYFLYDEEKELFLTFAGNYTECISERGEYESIYKAIEARENSFKNNISIFSVNITKVR